MDFKFALRLSFILVCATTYVYAARRVILRPLSAEEVVRILKLAGREDAIPKGRTVTQGLAAMTGFAVGLTKGIGGSLLFDFATSNATAQFINNFNATAMMNDFQSVNMTTLMQMFKLGSANNNNNPNRYKVTEICFDTRIEDPVVEEMGTQALSLPSSSIDTGIDGTDYPIRTGAAIDDTDVINNISTDEIADNENDQNCIVIQNPQRKRRSLLHRKRKRSF